MLRTPALLVGLAIVSATLSAQTPAGPSFEVASIKPNRTATPPTTLFPLGPGDAYAATGGLFRATNQPLIAYLRFAYRLGQGDLLDLPGWVYDERFDVQARASGDPTKDQMRLMMRAADQPGGRYGPALCGSATAPARPQVEIDNRTGRCARG